MEVAQPGCQRPDAVEAGRAEDEGTQLIVIPDPDIEPAIGLTASPGKLAGLRCWTWQALDRAITGTPALLPVTHAQGSPLLPVKQAIFSPQVQVRVVEQQPDGDTAQLAVR